ncbi:MAG: hypothetical protein KDC65_13795 [Saprospiraceae bacterium]|nr:hypothetical protein [Saprospiraceae bacterium]
MQTIAEVIERLQQIIDQAKKDESPLGYFAVIYAQMTGAVKEGIERGIFENGSRMEQLDVRFAMRYFDALDAWQAGKPCSRAWAQAFEASKHDEHTVLQHIMLGINAHVNLDLCIAAAHTRSGDAIFGMRKDFDLVNDIIASLTDGVQQKLAEIWLPFGWLDFLLRTEDEGWINFSMKTARGAAWKAAVALAFARHHDTEAALIRDLDSAVSAVAGKLRRPGWLIRLGLGVMQRTERGSVSEKIETLILI